MGKSQNAELIPSICVAGGIPILLSLIDSTKLNGRMSDEERDKLSSINIMALTILQNISSHSGIFYLFILFYFYFILFYFILFYFILFYFILFYFILFYFIFVNNLFYRLFEIIKFSLLCKYCFG